jgi:hypothetical protein
LFGGLFLFFAHLGEDPDDDERGYDRREDVHRIVEVRQGVNDVRKEVSEETAKEGTDKSYNESTPEMAEHRFAHEEIEDERDGESNEKVDQTNVEVVAEHAVFSY